jgi:flagellar biosynthesis GTPase FlhF
MATESKQSAHGVRTYRGRTLEEILPQIREELGPDAVILREREGLVGGVGGFFAQRFIEVEARRGDGQTIDIYDDSPEDDLAGRGPGAEPTVTDRRAVAELDAPVMRTHDAPVEAESGAAVPEAAVPEAALPEAAAPEAAVPEAAAPEPRSAEPRPFVPPSVQPPPQAPREQAPPREQVPAAARSGDIRVLRPAPPVAEPPARESAAEPPARESAAEPPARESPAEAPARESPAKPPAAPGAFETNVFLERLRAASQVLPDEDDDELDVSSLGTAATPREIPVPEPPADTAAPEDPSEPAPAPARGQRTARPRPERKPRSEAPRKPPGSTRRPPASTRKPPSRQAQAEAAPEPAEAGVSPVPVVPPAPAPAPPEPPYAGAPSAAPSFREPAPNPYESLRQRPPSLRAGLTTAQPAPETAAPPPPPPASTPTAAAAGPRQLEIREHRHGLIRSALARLFGRGPAPRGIRLSSPPHQLDAVAAAAIVTDLSTRGASQSFAAELINTVGAHGSPLAGSLRAAAEAEVARRIVPPPTLPATGAAVAFIGAGGSGKTRCTAALASAYSRTSTLGVTVISLDDPEGARELSRLLAGDGVPVHSLSGERAARTLADARQGGFVIVDTPTATPTDPAAVQGLGQRLAALSLDATFVTLPATLGAQAARRALSGFGALNPSAVAITHADETDQLAVIVEIAIAHRIPLAYVHAGTDHRTSLSAAKAAELARQLFPS